MFKRKDLDARMQHKDELGLYDDAEADVDLGDNDDEMDDLAMGMNFMQAQPAAAQKSSGNDGVDDVDNLDMGAMKIGSAYTEKQQSVINEFNGISNEDLIDQVIDLMLRQSVGARRDRRGKPMLADSILSFWYSFFGVSSYERRDTGNTKTMLISLILANENGNPQITELARERIEREISTLRQSSSLNRKIGKNDFRRRVLVSLLEAFKGKYPPGMGGGKNLRRTRNGRKTSLFQRRKSRKVRKSHRRKARK